MDVKEKFKKGVKNLNEYIALIKVDASSYQEANLEILKLLVNEQKIPGVYVSLNKPFKTMKRLLKKNKIDTKLIIFIDGITKVPENEKRQENCLFIGSPEKLSDISVAIDQAISALPTKKKFLFLDSINTLQLFNKLGTVARFIHFLAGKIREWRIKGIIISLKKGTDEILLNELAQLCDIEIDLGGD